MYLNDTLVRVLKAAEEVHYQNTIYRGLLEVNGRRNWKADYAQAMQNQNLRGIHHEIQGFRRAFESLEQQDDPEQIIQALLRIVPTS
jgi:hypothetical protein